MDNNQSLAEKLIGFSDAARCVSECEVMEVPVFEVRSSDSWTWAGGVGVYYFKNTAEMLYIGRALPGTKFGKRVWSHLQHGDDEWDASIDQNGAILGVIQIPEDMWYLAASLELYLMAVYNPRFNKRRG